MMNFNKIGEDLFNKIRGRFPSVTIGDEEGNVTNEPESARFFDFDYKTNERKLGKVSLSISEDNGLTVIYSRDFIQNEDETTQGEWYNFLKELRKFSKKRMLDFSVRDINKSNLNKRDYQFLANRPGDDKMNESKLYGTARVSYQKVDNARLVIKHTESINTENSTSRTQKIGAIYIESADGERFKYPYKHLSGARAMARHVAEGGKPYDDFGSHITSLSEELNKLRKFKSYMGRSSVMAESLAGYMDIVRERIGVVKKTIDSLQKPNYYQETFGNFVKPVFEEVPGDVAENWIDELTIKQFNEELSDVFPYIYKLVGEATRAKELGPDDLEEAVAKIACTECDEVSTAAAWKKNNNFCPKCKTSNKGVAEGEELDESGLQYYTGVKKHGKEYMKKAAQAGRDGASQEELGRLEDRYSKAAKNKKTSEEFELEQAFESMMGQFSDHVCEDCGNLSWRTLATEEIEQIEEAEKKGLYYYVNKRKKAGTSRSKNSPKAPSDQDWKNAAKTAKESVEDETNEEKKKGSHGKVCWKGYRRGKGNDCHKVGEDDTDEGNAFAYAVRRAKKDGKERGDTIDGPDGKEITLEKEQKTPLGEFILSYFDRESGQFPKGETAVLTMIEKDYGEEFIEPAKAFIEQINNLIAERYGFREPDIQEDNYELDDISRLAGLR